MKKSILTLLVLTLISIFSYAQKNITFQSKLPYTQQLSNLWGYRDDLGREFAIVGTETGVSIVNITNPTQPVEVFFASGQSTIWREPKVWKKYAFIAADNVSEGMMIIDLSQLPTSANFKFYTDNGISSGHTVFIDEKGFAYLFGSNIANGGAVVLDLTDPWNPVMVGSYDQQYIHDGYVRNDTLYAGEIYTGSFTVIDFRDKTNPIILATQQTPSAFTHNTWLSDNGKNLFTTDEEDNAFVTSYDLTDLANIKELDRYQTNPGSNSVPHNTYFLNNFLVTSYYKEGVTVVDATRPDFLVEVGNYDTSPLSGAGMDGCWGVYPFLPSGNIICSDMQEGLFVLKPIFKKVSYLKGYVYDSQTNLPIQNVKVELTSQNVKSVSDVTGNFKMGIPDSGNFTVSFNHPQYLSTSLNNIHFTTGQITSLSSVALQKLKNYTLSGKIVDSSNISGITSAKVLLYNNDLKYQMIALSDGTFKIDSVYPGNYQFVAGKWGYKTNCKSITIIDSTNLLNLKLNTGYMDDFSFDFGWVVNSTATSGMWVNGDPIMTDYDNKIANPGDDIPFDCSDFCMVTGNRGQSVAFDDIDNGMTTITSPVFDLSSYSNPFISYYRWFFNGGGSGLPNDSLIIKITNGTNTVTLERIKADTNIMSQWINHTIKIKSFINITSTMSLIVSAADYNPGHIVEAGLDGMTIYDSIPTNLINNPFSKSDIRIFNNLVKDQIGIEIPSDRVFNNLQITIYDLSGKSVFNKSFENQVRCINLDPVLKNGLYLIKIQNDKNILYTSKVIKIK